MRKAQAALEYMMTYGWALLAIIAVLGILVYFRAGSAEDTIPSSCTFGTQFNCDQFIAAENGTFAFSFVNLHDETINLTGVECSVPNQPSWTQTYSGAIIPTGDKGTLVCNPPVAYLLNGKEKIEAKLYFRYDEAQSLPRVQTGSLIVSVLETGAVADSIFADYAAENTYFAAE
jgi:hypothetical protein